MENRVGARSAEWDEVFITEKIYVTYSITTVHCVIFSYSMYTVLNTSESLLLGNVLVFRISLHVYGSFQHRSIIIECYYEL
jgi:hypothetical protein